MMNNTRKEIVKKLKEKINNEITVLLTEYITEMTKTIKTDINDIKNSAYAEINKRNTLLFYLDEWINSQLAFMETYNCNGKYIIPTEYLQMWLLPEWNFTATLISHIQCNIGFNLNFNYNLSFANAQALLNDIYFSQDYMTVFDSLRLKQLLNKHNSNE